MKPIIENWHELPEAKALLDAWLECKLAVFSEDQERFDRSLSVETGAASALLGIIGLQEAHDAMYAAHCERKRLAGDDEEGSDV